MKSQFIPMPEKCLRSLVVLGMVLSLVSQQSASGEDVPKVRKCGSATRYEQLYRSDAKFRALRKDMLALTLAYKSIHRGGRVPVRTAPIRIPVVVHVVYNSPEQNISDDQIQSQIEALNKDYQNVGQDLNAIPAPFRRVIGNPLLKFELAVRAPDGTTTNGITRTKTDAAEFFSDGPQGDFVKFRKHGGEDAWDSGKYLNIWVCGVLKAPNGDVLLGYSSFPGESPDKDGVAIVYNAFGTRGTLQPTFNKGRTATHEIGHWLNLFHIWGDDENEADKCSGSDQVDDTPNQAIANTGCPSFPHPSCRNNDKGEGGDMFINYMDYTDDACMRMFTAGQVLRINATLDGIRVSIQTSPGLSHVP